MLIHIGYICMYLSEPPNSVIFRTLIMLVWDPYFRHNLNEILMVC